METGGVSVWRVINQSMHLIEFGGFRFYKGRVAPGNTWVGSDIFPQQEISVSLVSILCACVAL